MQVVALIREENGVYRASFPDFPGCTTAANDPNTVIAKATEALSHHIARMMADGRKLPRVRSLALIARRKRPRKLDPSILPAQCGSASPKKGRRTPMSRFLPCVRYLIASGRRRWRDRFRHKLCQATPQRRSRASRKFLNAWILLP